MADKDFDGILSGRNPTMLANAVSDAIRAARDNGMDLDQALCVAAQVVTDYARVHHGASYVDKLIAIMRERCQSPVPTTVHSADGAREEH